MGLDDPGWLCGGMLMGTPDIDYLWGRIRSHEGEEFATVTEMPFTYAVTSSALFVTRNSKWINRSLSPGKRAP